MINFIINSIHWNVNPEIFNLNLDFIGLGALSVRWYGLLFAGGLLIGYRIGEKMLRSENVPQKWIDALFFYIVIATVVGARLGHVFFYGWEYYSQHPAEIIKVWHGGLASHGGAIGIIIVLLIYSKKVSKRNFWWVVDRIAVPTALVGAFIRTGNLMNSEIYGTVTSLPWGFIFERNGETLAKHPTQIYEALAYLISFGILSYLYWKKKGIKHKEGFLSGLFFVLIFLSRFLIEFIKEDQEAFEATMTLNMGQWLSVPFIIVGIFLIYRSLKRPEVVYKTPKKDSK